MNSRALSGLFVGILISATFLWYAFKDVDLFGVWQGMLRVGVGWVFASAALSVLSHVFRAWRWRFLLPDLPTVKSWSLISATFIGIMANNVLPARLGEVARAWALASRERVPGAVAFGSVVVERLVDAAFLLTVLGVCLLLVPGSGGRATGLLWEAGLGVLLLVTILLGGLVTVMWFRGRFLQAGEQWAVRTGRDWLVSSLVHLGRFLEGCCAFRSLRQAGLVLGLSALIWGSAIAAFYVMAEGFRLPITMVQVTLVFVIVMFGIAIPSAPGFIGTFHGFCVAGLSLVAGVEATQAAAYATLLHGTGWLAVNLVGFLCLVLDRSLTWAGMARLIGQRAIWQKSQL